MVFGLWARARWGFEIRGVYVLQDQPCGVGEACKVCVARGFESSIGSISRELTDELRQSCTSSMSMGF